MQMASKLSSFLVELKRRKVTRVAVVYALVGLGVIEAASMIFPALFVPEWAFRLVVALILLGFPVSLVLAWALEVTPDGIQRTPHLSPDQLASQTPERWSASSWVLASGSLVVVLAAGYFVFFRGADEPVLPEDEVVQDPSGDLVAVFPFVNRTGDPTLDHFGPLAADRIAEGLSWIGAMRMVASSRVEEALRNQAEGETIQELAEDLEAGANGERGFSVESSGPALDPGLILADLQQRAAGGMFLSRSMSMDPRFLLRMPTFSAAQSFVRGGSISRSGDQLGALPHYFESYEADTTFLQPLLSAASALESWFRWSEADSLLAILGHRLDQMSRFQRLSFELTSSAVSGNHVETLRLYRLMIQEDSELDPWYMLGRHALVAGYAVEALEALEGMPEEYREYQWLWYWEHLAWANHAVGRFQGALDAAREGRARFPEFVNLRWREIQALVAMGRLEETVPLLDELERMEPDEINSPGVALQRVATDLARFGHREEARRMAERAIDWYLARDPEGYQSGRARGLLLANRPRDALGLLESMVEEDPDNITLRGLLGVALALTDDPTRAEAQATWLEELDRPFLHGSNTYWRAAILGHLGRKDEAVRLLRRAFEEGLSHQLRHPDPLLLPLWDYEPFEELMAPKG